MHGRGHHAWQGGCAWQGTCMAGVCVWWGVCMVGEGGHAWQERQPLQQTVRILLECILVIRQSVGKTFISNNRPNYSKTNYA